MDINKLILATAEFFSGDARRIQHFIKVHSFARIIARGEDLTTAEQNTIEAAAVVHDTGIKPAEQKFGKCDGKLHEQEGPAVARPLLEAAGATPQQAERICWLIAHHHTYTGNDSADYRILVEADFLVNIYEDGIPKENAVEIRKRIFRIATGTELLNKMFGLN